MTIEQKRKILVKIAYNEADIEELQRVRMEILTSGYASATFSSGGGSKSYTHQDVGKINEAIELLQSNIKSLKSLLTGTNKGTPSKIINVYF